MTTHVTAPESTEPTERRAGGADAFFAQVRRALTRPWPDDGQPASGPTHIVIDLTDRGSSHVSMGEYFAVPECLVVAPATGRFQPRQPETFTTEGEIVCSGQVIGTVASSGEDVPVVSRFTGFLMGLLAEPSERVRAGQPVAWLRRIEQ